MSRLSVYLDRRLPAWRDLLAPGAMMFGLARWAQFAGPRQMVRLSRTLALEPASFKDYCTSVRPAPVASGEALLAGPFRAPRIWTLAAPTPVPDHSRVIIVDGVRQPSFASNPAIYRQTQQAYLRARSAIVYPRPGLVMIEPGTVLRNDLPKWAPDHRLTPGFMDFVGGKLVARRSKLQPRGRVRRTVLALCHAFHPSYGHWLFDCLPYLLPWREFIRQGRLALLVRPLADWQRRTLDLLGVPASAVIEAAEPSVICDDVIVPGLWPTEVEPTTRPKTNWSPQPGPCVVEVTRILRAQIRSTITIDPPERIYISRRGIQSFRYLRNEDEVEAAMMRLGFAIVRPQELSFDEQVATFARARVIAGPLGAGQTNAAFAPAGCLVFEICVDSWLSQWMLRLTQLFGHHYLPLAFPPDAECSQPIVLDNATFGQPHFYTVQPDTLVAVLANEMRKLGIERAENRDAMA